MIKLNSKIYVAGHKGLVGSAIVRELKKKGYTNIITTNKKKLDLTNQSKVLKFLLNKKPDFIFIAAAKVGGIFANNRFKADFIYENLAIQTNLIHGAFLSGIKNLIFLGSSCVYPRNCKQPIKESYLLTGELESTNDAYAIAKIAGIKMCQSYNEQYKTNYVCLMPTNSFGPNDKYSDLNSHFIPALIKKIHKLKACVFFMKKNTKHSLINIGSGKEHSIEYYAKLFLKVIKPNNKIFIKYDKSKPNGSPRKIMDITLAKKYNGKPKINLEKDIFNTYKSYLKEMKL